MLPPARRLNILPLYGSALQITKPLNITDEQLAQLDLHSFLNILNIIMGELQLLKLELGDDSALPESTRLADDLLRLVRAGRLDVESAQLATTLRGVFLKEWSAVARQAPEAASQPSLSESAGNLDSILQIMAVRLTEYLERLREGLQWKPHSARQLTENFVNFTAALEKNSRGRYQIIFNIAAKHPCDYLINFKIEGFDGDTIIMPPALQDVFRDLIANARKYTPPGGHLAAGLCDDGRMLKMAVEDHGCGIPPDEIERVVEFGYRASNVHDKATCGGGFGLTKAYHIITRLGGTLEITSTLGQGTFVKALIPRPQSAR